MDNELQTAREVLADYGLGAATVAPLGSGLVNRTFRIAHGSAEQFVLQRLHPVFPAAVNAAIDAVTRHLAAKGLPTPRLVPARDGRLYVTAGPSMWRLLTFVEGRTFETVPDPSIARSAGRLLARFHEALTDLAYDFTGQRRCVHDLSRHLETLQITVQSCRGHRLAGEARRLTRDIFALADDNSEVLTISDRVVHGDPKISNVLFRGDPAEAYCLLDLDTVSRMPVVFELGDAFRSWCNPYGEDTVEASFSMPLFAAAVGGYATTAGRFIRVNEWQAIVPAIRRIGVELAARFCADALREEYFGWNAARFGSRGEHNLVRAAGQLNLVRSLVAQADAATAVVERAFAGDHA